jgi:hypothetical protein
MTANRQDPSAAAGPPWWQVVADDGDEHRRRTRQARTKTEPRTEPETGAQSIAVRVLRGRRTTTVPGLFAEFALGWGFPDYFGHNWAALEDCLTDLAWIPAPGYLCVIDRAESLLTDETPVALAMFTDLLERVGRFWAAPIALGEPWDRPARPFRTVLLATGEHGAGRIQDRLHLAGVLDPGPSLG